MAAKTQKSEQPKETETPRETKEQAVYTPNEVKLLDAGLTACVHGVDFRAFVTFVAPVIGRIFGAIHTAYGQNRDLKMTQGELVGHIFQGLGVAMAANPDAVIRMLANMSDLSEEQVSALSPHDGSLLLQACAERINIDDIRCFFGGTSRLSGQSMPGIN